jgi:1-deoxy-D-xylulose-5-phosphate reductoisomerase
VKKKDVRKVILTASGGPFFRTPPEELKNKTIQEALAHPRWKMGKKVTVDSSTLMNKGLELIEARWLFDLKPEQLGILIHPQSIVHSLVETRDASVLAQLSPTDMKIPIQYALTYPGREESLIPSLDLASVRALEFYPVEESRYPLIKLALRALKENASNEVAVSAFLAGRIGFLDINAIVLEALEHHQARTLRTLEDILEVDRETRTTTSNLIKQRK